MFMISYHIYIQRSYGSIMSMIQGMLQHTMICNIYSLYMCTEGTVALHEGSSMHLKNGNSAKLVMQVSEKEEEPEPV